MNKDVCVSDNSCLQTERVKGSREQKAKDTKARERKEGQEGVKTSFG